MKKALEVFLKTIKDAALEFPFVIAETQTFLEPVLDAIVNEEEFHKMRMSDSQHWT